MDTATLDFWLSCEWTPFFPTKQFWRKQNKRGGVTHSFSEIIKTEEGVKCFKSVAFLCLIGSILPKLHFNRTNWNLLVSLPTRAGWKAVLISRVPTGKPAQTSTLRYKHCKQNCQCVAEGNQDTNRDPNRQQAVHCSLRKGRKLLGELHMFVRDEQRWWSICRSSCTEH